MQKNFLGHCVDKTSCNSSQYISETLNSCTDYTGDQLLLYRV